MPIEPETTKPKDTADKVIEFGEVMVKIGKILKPLNDEERKQVVRTAAAWYDVPIVTTK